jgi:hypothetical protein
MQANQQVPSVGAGLEEVSYRTLPGETRIETRIEVVAAPLVGI